MDQELKAILESLIEGQNVLNARFDKLESKMENLDSRMNDFDSRFDKVDNELSHIKEQLDRMESDANEDVVAMLEVISSKVETLATKEDIEYLAGKLGQHDLEIDRLKRIK